jgi:hypothetical protein
VSLAWDERKRLLRLAGVAEELLSVAEASGHEAARAGLPGQLAFLMNEVQEVLASDPVAAEEFERLVVRGPGAEVPTELRAAALVGWLKAELAAESIEESRDEQAASRPPSRRKQTVGFKIRSPITREQRIPEGLTAEEQDRSGMP